MKLLLVGATENWSLETFYLKYFREISDINVDILSTSDFAKQFYRRFIDKVVNRIFPNRNPYYNKFNQYLLDYIHRTTPEAILVFKGMEIYPETLKLIQSRGILLANYNPDHPFIIVSRGSGNRNIGQSISFYDLHFCYSKALVNQLELEFNTPAVYLPFGFELNEADFNQLEQRDEILRICFIGNPDNIRVNIIKSLLADNLEVDIYGYHWKKYINRDLYPGLKIFDAVFGLDFWATARQYRIQLNIFRPHNTGSHNMRTFEIPAVGGIMLAPDSPEHRDFFKEGQDFFCYSDMEDLKEKITHILGLSLQNAQNIRENARAKSLTHHYDYRSRTQIIDASLRKNLAKKKSDTVE